MNHDTMTLAAQVLDDMLPASKRAEMLDLEQLVEEKVDGGQIQPQPILEQLLTCSAIPPCHVLMPL